MPDKTTVHDLIERWAAQFAESIEAMAGEKPAIQWRPRGVFTPSADVFWWEQPFSAGLDTMVWVGTPQATWLHIGNQVLTAAGLEQADPSEARGTYLEILRQALSGFAQSIGGVMGREVVCRDGKEPAPPAHVPNLHELQISFGRGPLPPVFLGLSQPLAEIIEPAEFEVIPAARPDEESTAAGLARKSKTLDLLLELELPVSVSFGRAELPLRDVLKLTTGSIIELNRAVSDPVELIVNNCMIARGEVVVVEGNYGVRINEIVSRQERMKTIR